MCLLVSGINIYLMAFLPGRLFIKKLSAEEIEELEGFFGQNFHGQRSVTISAEKFAKALADSRFKEIQHWRSLRGILECLCMQRWK